MKTDSEMTADILNEVQRRTRQRRRRASVLAAALVIVLTATAVFATQKAGLLPPRESGARSATDKSQTNEAVSQESGKEPTEPFATSRADAQTTNGIAAPTAQRPATTGDPTTTQGASAPDKSGGDEYGGPIGGVRIPVLPFDRSIQYTGEAITDAEAAAYFKENTWLQSALGASGVDASGIRFAEHGYCHVSYDGVEGKSFEVRQNFRDYLVWNGKGDLIAIVTLTKENGQLSATPAFGAPWFESYQRFLKLYAGQPLVFVYAGWMEMVITPDEGVYNPQGTDVSRYLEGIENPYEIFRCDAATYVP